MENPIIVPFDLNTARKIKSGEIEGSVLIGNIKIEFVYESKDCADRYNLLFVKKDESGISAIYADTEGRTFFNNVLELEVEAGAYFKKGDGYNMCRETKKKLLQAIKGVNVEEEDVSLYTTGGWD